MYTDLSIQTSNSGWGAIYFLSRFSFFSETGGQTEPIFSILAERVVIGLSTAYAFNSPVQNHCQESGNLYREARHCCYIAKLEEKKVMVGLYQNARAKHFVNQ